MECKKLKNLFAVIRELFKENKSVWEHSNDLIDKVMSTEEVCSVIFKGLDEICQNEIINHVLQVNQCAFIDSSKIPDSLFNFYIYKIVPAGNSPILNPEFSNSLRNLLFTNKLEPCDNPSYSSDVEMSNLMNYGIQRWDIILNFILQRCNLEISNYVNMNHSAVSRDVFNVLTFSNILCPIEIENETISDNNGQSKKYKITPTGFNFLLMNTCEQICFYVYHFLSFLLKNNEKDKFFSFLHILCFMNSYNISVPISIEEFKCLVNNSDHMRHLREIGLIYRKNSNSPNICFTPIALDALTFVKNKKSYFENVLMIVETNLRLYVYNSVPIITCLVSLFAEALFFFPDFVIFSLSRKSVQNAYCLGITSQQILKFLTLHMNKISKFKPEGSSSNVLFPQTVSDQLKLWEIERNRLKYFNNAVLLQNFASVQTYELILRELKNYQSGSLFHDDSRKIVVVTKEIFEQLKMKSIL